MAIVNKKALFKSFLQIFFVAAGLSLAACTSTQPAPVEESPEVAAVPEPAAEPEIVDTYEGDGLELTVDGSSMEAFDASMARIKRHTDAASYKSLEAAIGYLLVYDLSARGDKEKLIARLDGLNGYEIMDKVGWRKPPPNKSKAEKGAADATIET